MSDDIDPIAGGANPAESEPAPDHIARSIGSVVQRTRSALTPWTRQVAGLAARPMQRVWNPSRLSARPAGVAQPRMHSLASRVQRSASLMPVLRRRPVAVQSVAVSAFTNKVVQRMPQIAAKFEPREMGGEVASAPPLALADEVQAPELSAVTDPSPSPFQPPRFQTLSGTGEVESAPSAVQRALESGPTIDTSGPSIAAQLRKIRAAAKAARRAQQEGSTPPRPSQPTVQRMPQDSGVSSQPVGVVRPRRGQVEEITPEPRPGSDDSPTSAAPARPARPTRPPRSSAPPRVQRQPASPPPVESRRLEGSVTDELRQRIAARRAEVAAASKPPAARQPQIDAPHVATDRPRPQLPLSDSTPPVVQRQEEEEEELQPKREPVAPPVVRRQAEEEEELQPKRAPAASPVVQRQAEEEEELQPKRAPAAPPVVRRQEEEEEELQLKREPVAPPVVRRQEEEEEELQPKREPAAPPAVQRQGEEEEEELQPKRAPAAPPVVQRQAEEEEELQPKREPAAPPVVQRQAEEEEELQPKREPAAPPVVQRQGEEEEEELQLQRESAAPVVQRQAEEEEELQPKREPVALPVVQRQEEEEEELQPKREPAAPPVVQRVEESASSGRMPLVQPKPRLPRVGPVDETPANVQRDELEPQLQPASIQRAPQPSSPEQQSFRRAPIGTETPLIAQTRAERPLSVIKPTAVLPETRPTNGAPVVQRMVQRAAPLPVVERKPPVRREPDPPQVQRRQDLESKTSTTPTPTMAKAESETTAGPDVNELARQVLPIIKRMLVVERERRRG